MAREGEGFALETQLHVAARGGEVERLKRLILQRADVNKAGLGLGVINIHDVYFDIHQGKSTWHRSHVLVYISPVQFPTFWGLCHVFLPPRYILLWQPHQKIFHRCYTHNKNHLHPSLS